MPIEKAPVATREQATCSDKRDGACTVSAPAMHIVKRTQGEWGPYFGRENVTHTASSWVLLTTMPTETDRVMHTETDRAMPTETDRAMPTETDRAMPTETDRAMHTEVDQGMITSMKASMAHTEIIFPMHTDMEAPFGTG